MQDALAGLRVAHPGGRRSRLGSWRLPFDQPPIVLAATLGSIGYLTIPPILTVFYASLQSDFLGDESRWTLSHYVELFGTAANRGIILNSLIYAGGTMAFATFNGAALAFLFMRSDVPLRRFLFVLGMLPML